MRLPGGIMRLLGAIMLFVVALTVLGLLASVFLWAQHMYTIGLDPHTRRLLIVAGVADLALFGLGAYLFYLPSKISK